MILGSAQAAEWFSPVIVSVHDTLATALTPKAIIGFVMQITKIHFGMGRDPACLVAD
jgi:hypothetical protein